MQPALAGRFALGRRLDGSFGLVEGHQSFGRRGLLGELTMNARRDLGRRNSEPEASQLGDERARRR